MPPALMVFARVDSSTPTRPRWACGIFRSIDVGPTDAPSFVVFAIVEGLSVSVCPHYQVATFSRLSAAGEPESPTPGVHSCAPAPRRRC